MDHCRCDNGSAASSSLNGRWCVVTGASRGIGRAVALALARQHARLILVARSEGCLKEVCGCALEAGACAAEGVVASLDSRQATDTAIEQIKAKIQAAEAGATVYALVNNAGSVLPSGKQLNILEDDPDDVEAMLYLNLMAPMRMTREFAPGMAAAHEGLIVNIASTSALGPAGNAYSTSKYGLRGWSLNCAQFLRKHNIKVVCICPGWVDTPAVSAIKGVDHSRMIRPEDVAEAVLLAVNCSANCCPEEVVLRTVLPVGSE